jgi:hypothetical protein
MARFILRYGASAAAPAEHVQNIRAMPGIRVIDQSPKMLLVDADEAALRDKIKSLPGWSVHVEHQIQLPDTRKTLE